MFKNDSIFLWKAKLSIFIGNFDKADLKAHCPFARIMFLRLRFICRKRI